MNIFKKILGDDEEEMNEELERSSNLSGYQDVSQPEDYTKPKPQFVLFKPVEKEELRRIADCLLNRKTVILNLENITDDRRRYIDFLSGVSYALNGQLKKVAVHTYLIIPGGLEITGEIFSEIEENLEF